MLPPQVINMAKVMIAIMLLNHRVACGWYGVLAMTEGIDGSSGDKYTTAMNGSLAMLGFGSWRERSDMTCEVRLCGPGKSSYVLPPPLEPGAAQTLTLNCAFRAGLARASLGEGTQLHDR